MAILTTRWLSLVLMVTSPAGCYSPELRDCSVQCTTSTDCGGGQICGSDQYCASPERAGHCAQIAGPDGGADPDGRPDARPPRDAMIDAPIPIDAFVHPYLRLKVIGKGRIDAAGIGSCDTESANAGDCRYDIDLGMPIDLHAEPADGYELDTWTSAICANAPGLDCTFTPTTVESYVSVRFRKD